MHVELLGAFGLLLTGSKAFTEMLSRTVTDARTESDFWTVLWSPTKAVPIFLVLISWTQKLNWLEVFVILVWFLSRKVDWFFFYMVRCVFYNSKYISFGKLPKNQTCFILGVSWGVSGFILFYNCPKKRIKKTKHNFEGTKIKYVWFLIFFIWYFPLNCFIVCVLVHTKHIDNINWERKN